MRPRLGSAPSRSSKRGSVIALSPRSLAFPRPRLVSGPARMPWAVPTPFSMPVREAMIKHKIPSESSVKAWCRQYRESGEAALVDKPRGRKPRVKKAE